METWLKCKILACRYCSNVSLHLELHQDNITKGHSLKLVNSRCHYDLRKFSSSVRNIWNSLPASVNSANNVNTFINRLDWFWTNQELMYDYKISLTGIGSRSYVDSFDYTIFSCIITVWICTERQKWRQCVLMRYLITRVSVNRSLASVWICVRANYSRELFARVWNGPYTLPHAAYKFIITMLTFSNLIDWLNWSFLVWGTVHTNPNLTQTALFLYQSVVYSPILQECHYLLTYRLYVSKGCGV